MEMNVKTSKQAMIFAAGLGTRLKPLTDTMPKALVRVGGKTLLEHVVERLKGAGFEHIVVNVHHFSGMIVDYLRRNNDFGIDIRVSDETPALLDTGGGIKHAASLFDSDMPVLIHNVDIFSDINLTELYCAGMASDATLLVSRRKTSRYLLFDDDMTLVGWTNIETGEVRSPYAGLDVSKCWMYAFSGIHVFSPRLFSLMDTFPDKFGIMDFYLKICDKINIRGMVKDGLRLMDVGKTDILSDAEAFLSQCNADGNN